MARLEGKVAIVTGGASGIGRACALRFAEEHAKVLVADVQAKRGEEVAAEIRARGGRAAFVETDAASEQANEAMADRALAEFGAIDVLLASAGISHGKLEPGNPATAVDASTITAPPKIFDRPVADFDRVLAVNLRGAMLSNRAVALRMTKAGKGGSIVNVTSIAGYTPFAGVGDYCVSKAGLWMLTRVLAAELGPQGIRVNAIAPGTILTPMSAGYLAEEAARQAVAAAVPLRRLGEPSDIAGAAVFLASDESSYVTGITVGVHGGALP